MREYRSSTRVLRTTSPRPSKWRSYQLPTRVLGCSAALIPLSADSAPLVQTPIAVSGDRAMPRTFCEQLLFVHQASHPLTRTLDPLIPQLGMYPWAPIHPTIGLENDLHLVSEFGIFPAVLARRALAPGIVPADRHIEHSAHQRDGILVPVFPNELVSHALSREKMPTAFFRISRSCLTISNSRLRRRTSSSWSV